MIESRVSAVITAYNSAAFIADAIRSVLKQTRAVDEIVVVDDGSTDPIRQVLDEFAKEGIKYIQQPHRGAGAARNRGIRETSGEYIAFLDADDIWLEDKTRLQLDYLAAHPQAALVSGYAHWWNTARDIVRIRGRILPNQKILRREITVHNIIGKSSMVMLRRSALNEVGTFSETIRWGQDWDLWQRLIERCDAGFIPEVVAVYRWHQGNLSHIRKWERILSYWDISRSAIGRSQPIWWRPVLLARAWSNFTHRRAKYAIQFAFPRWRHVWYALAAFVVYPFEMTRDKFNALVRAITGEGLYRSAKKALRARAQAGGPR